MKKFLIVMLTIVALTAFFTACTVSSNDTESVLTTAVTDENGKTHYYEIVTDEENSTVLNEIKTDDQGNPVADKNGGYETIHNQKSSAKITTSAAPESTANANAADNEVKFDSDDNLTSESDTRQTKREKYEITERTTAGNVQPATDADGWINKWY